MCHCPLQRETRQDKNKRYAKLSENWAERLPSNSGCFCRAFIFIFIRSLYLTGIRDTPVSDNYSWFTLPSVNILEYFVPSQPNWAKSETRVLQGSTWWVKLCWVLHEVCDSKVFIFFWRRSAFSRKERVGHHCKPPSLDSCIPLNTSHGKKITLPLDKSRQVFDMHKPLPKA